MASSTAPQTHTKALSLGLGAAVERLINLHTRVSMGVATSAQREERRMILEALNVIPLDLDFACSIERAPKTVELFQKSAQTSCCRLVPPTVTEDMTKRTTSRRRGSSRSSSRSSSSSSRSSSRRSSS